MCARVEIIVFACERAYMYLVNTLNAAIRPVARTIYVYIEIRVRIKCIRNLHSHGHGVFKLACGQLYGYGIIVVTVIAGAVCGQKVIIIILGCSFYCFRIVDDL